MRELFLELEFFSLADELDTAADALVVNAAEEIATDAVWRERVASWNDEPVIAAIGAPAIGLAVEAGEEVLYADLRGDGALRAAVFETVLARLSSGGQVVGHDLKEVLRAVGFAADDDASLVPLLDLHVASFIAHPDVRHHDLANLALRHLQFKATTEKEAGWVKREEPAAGSTELLQYAGERVTLVRALTPKIERELGEGALETIYRELEEPLIPLLVRMEERGIGLDGSFLEAMSGEMTKDLETLEAQIYEIAGGSLQHQLAGRSSERCSSSASGTPSSRRPGRPRATRPTPRPSRSSRPRATRSPSTSSPTASSRSCSRPTSMPCRSSSPRTVECTRATTRSGRRPAGCRRRTRTCRTSPSGRSVGSRSGRPSWRRRGAPLVVADYSQVELRILAHIADEDAMISAFNSGADIHRSTAAAVLGVAEELVTDEQRRAAKAINFGIIYGISGFGLGRNLGIPKSEADRFIKNYLERYPGVQEYMDETLSGVEKTSRVETMYGRIRRLPDIHAKNRNLRENAKRMAINARIQGTAADFLKKAMIAVEARLAADIPSAKLLLTVHDELVLEVDKGSEEQVAELLREEMSSVEKLAVPLVVDVGWGSSWYDAKD